jgi:ketosteroid isomerase-like protein
MSQENVRLAHEVIDAVERRDLSSLIDLTDSDVDWHSAFAMGGRYRGHAGMRKYIKDMNDAWEVVRLDVDHELGVGDIVLFVGRIHYRGKGSGVEAESRSGYVLTFREGLVVRFRPFRDPEKALEAVGLSEQDAHADS